MDKKLVRQAAKSIELLDITITDQSIATDSNAYAFGLMEAGATTQQTRRFAEISLGEYKFDGTEAETVIVQVHFGTRLVEEVDEADEHAEDPHVYAEITATIRLEYAVTSELPSAEAMQEFADFNAVHNAYPFWREIVFSLANSAKLPPVFVPLYRDAASGHITRNIVRSGQLAKRKKKRKKTKTSKAAGVPKKRSSARRR